MKLRNLIIFLVFMCIGIIAQDSLCQESQSHDENIIPEATCCPTTFTSTANNYALTSTSTIATPNLRTNGFRRTTSHTNSEAKISHAVKEISKRYFTKTTNLPSLFQTTCSSSGEYLISIGILVI